MYNVAQNTPEGEPQKTSCGGELESEEVVDEPLITSEKKSDLKRSQSLKVKREAVRSKVAYGYISQHFTKIHFIRTNKLLK